MDQAELLARSGAQDALYIGIEENRLLLLMYSYAPYTVFPEGCIPLDAYYPASNASYHKAKELCEKIRTLGYFAQLFEDIPFKKCGLLSDKLLFGANRLLAHQDYGSYIVFQGIKTDLPVELPLLQYDPEAPILLNPICESCKKCIQACPGKALHKGFTRSRCLRDLMNKQPDEKSLRFLGDCLLGCTICRQVCPLNAKINPVDPPEELCALLMPDKLLDYNKQTKQGLTDYIGANMARRSMLVPIAIAWVIKNKRTDLYEKIKNLTNDESQRIEAAAQAAMQIMEPVKT